jgi:hypothetical protein
MPESRRRERFPFIQMDARVQVKKGLMSKEWSTINVQDFSRLGVAFMGDVSFSEGDRIQLSLKLTTEVGNIVVERASAVVKNTRPIDGGKIYGCEFGDNNKESVVDGLNRIESVVSRFRQVSERMHPGT